MLKDVLKIASPFAAIAGSIIGIITLYDMFGGLFLFAAFACGALAGIALDRLYLLRKKPSK